MKLTQLLLLMGLSLTLAACPSGGEQAKTEGQTTASAPAAETAASTAPAEAASAPAKAETASLKGNPEAGKKVFVAKTCIVCHMVSSVPEAKGAIGPKLDGIGKVAATRVAGQDAETYLKTSIEKPDAFLSPGYQNLMTAGLRQQMSDQEFADLVSFLQTL